MALRWNGSRWQSWPLPPHLTGFISDASAPSANDIWAVSYAGGYVLHWNGHHWAVVRHWRERGALTGVTALSASDVWVFGTTAAGLHGMGTWHFNGRTWTRVNGLAGEIYRASAVSRHDIWAVAATRKGGFLEHYNGRTWRQVRVGQGQARLDDVLAVARDDVWAVGNMAGRHGEGQLVVAHFDGRHWIRIADPLARRHRPAGRGHLRRGVGDRRQHRDPQRRADRAPVLRLPAQLGRRAVGPGQRHQRRRGEPGHGHGVDQRRIPDQGGRRRRRLVAPGPPH